MNDAHRLISPHEGLPFRDCLSLLHEIYRPSTYLEIGIRHGKSLALARCASIGVDPKPQLTCDVHGAKPFLYLAECTSDAFFASQDPRALLGAPIDFAFIDGLHLMEQVLNDFINVERFCSRTSIVVVHDCLPTDFYMTSRDPDARDIRDQSTNPGWWTGDVWKLVPILQRFRPDLQLELFNAPPTGLMVVTNLDPGSKVLATRQSEILREFQWLESEEERLRDFLSAAVISSTDLLSAKAKRN
ncbi:MAG: class I SAM-dependent methyltransferase [Bdellovibrionota bacterium]